MGIAAMKILGKTDKGIFRVLCSCSNEFEGSGILTFECNKCFLTALRPDVIAEWHREKFMISEYVNSFVA